MAYSEFTLAKVIQNFGLTICDRTTIFTDLTDLEPSQLLRDLLKDHLPLALASNTEKSRSELIITPILVELRRMLNNQISFFSGVDFSVDSSLGLNGNCDFIISISPELLLINAPVIILVEAKKENIMGGLGQCVAAMVAARIFNEKANNQITAIYGVVTTGTNWKFLKLVGNVVEIELGEYYINNVGQILSIFREILSSPNS